MQRNEISPTNRWSCGKLDAQRNSDETVDCSGESAEISSHETLRKIGLAEVGSKEPKAISHDFSYRQLRSEWRLLGEGCNPPPLCRRAKSDYSRRVAWPAIYGALATWCSQLWSPCGSFRVSASSSCRDIAKRIPYLAATSRKTTNCGAQQGERSAPLSSEDGGIWKPEQSPSERRSSFPGGACASLVQLHRRVPSFRGRIFIPPVARRAGTLKIREAPSALVNRPVSSCWNRSIDTGQQSAC